MSANFDKTVSVQFKSELHQWLKQRAIHNGHSFNAEVRILLGWIKRQIEDGKIEEREMKI